MASSRVYVQDGIYDEFVKKLEDKVKTWVVGDPFDPNVRQGPQVINHYRLNSCSNISNSSTTYA